MKNVRMILFLGVMLILMFSGVSSTAQQTNEPVLPLPSTMALDDFERLLFDFLDNITYDSDLNWTKDKRVRDTGPWIDGQYYGTHPAVRIFYSPEAIKWLDNDRQGELPDGTMLIKEMYRPPAARYTDMPEDQLRDHLESWTIMIRDSSGSKDGWFWGFYAPGQEVDTNEYPFAYPNLGFGQYCVRCHASAENEFLFSSLRNIEGRAGDPVIYRVDNSWLDNPNNLPETEPASSDEPESHEDRALGPDPAAVADLGPGTGLNPEFLRVFDQMEPVPLDAVQPFPPVTTSHVVSGPEGPEQFITSDQCMSCHDGQGLPFGPNMYIPAPDGHGDLNLSPFGEWSWSMMGLAGRDPIFFTQLESETTIHSSAADVIQDTCFRCHGVMGQRQYHIDHGDDSYFTADMVLDPESKYGALARDGISCTVCHQIVDDGKPLQDIVTGQFSVSEPGQFEPGISYVYGPFDDPAELAMVSSLGFKPVQDDYITSSRVCAGCHTIALPVLDAEGGHAGDIFEQATYLEWLNSDKQDVLAGGGGDPTTCQSCHMPNRLDFDFAGFFADQPLAFRIANIQDSNYPESDHLAPHEEITVPIREDFARHTLLGINVFALEMFNQFDDILGVRKTNFMTGSANGLPNAIEIATAQGQNRFISAELDILAANLDGTTLTAEVQVTNETGHRFPTGVGFRRAFLEFRVLDGQNRTIWVSGLTDSLGIIVDENGQHLPSEFHAVDPDTGEQLYQPHYETITQQNQVQIYQELVKNPQGEFTTSFLGLCDPIKDNRLLPKGWTESGPDGFPVFEAPSILPDLPPSATTCNPETSIEATWPRGLARDDDRYGDGSGTDVTTYQVTLPQLSSENPELKVVAGLYYQAIPPSWLKERFETAQGEAGQRLYHMASHLNVEDTSIEDWKLLVAADEVKVATERISDSEPAD